MQSRMVQAAKEERGRTSQGKNGKTYGISECWNFTAESVSDVVQSGANFVAGSCENMAIRFVTDVT